MEFTYGGRQLKLVLFLLPFLLGTFPQVRELRSELEQAFITFGSQVATLGGQ